MNTSSDTFEKVKSPTAEQDDDLFKIYLNGTNEINVNIQSKCSNELKAIENFTKTKESLRKVPQKIDAKSKSKQSIEMVDSNKNDTINVTATNDSANQENDEHDGEENYVKIPVHQLISTFEKQMRSVIKQNVNDKTQLNGKYLRQLDVTKDSSKQNGNNTDSADVINTEELNNCLNIDKNTHFNGTINTVTSETNENIIEINAQTVTQRDEKYESTDIYQYSEIENSQCIATNLNYNNDDQSNHPVHTSTDYQFTNLNMNVNNCENDNYAFGTESNMHKGERFLHKFSINFFFCRVFLYPV